jgi:hypothetical protein
MAIPIMQLHYGADFGTALDLHQVSAGDAADFLTDEANDLWGAGPEWDAVINEVSQGYPQFVRRELKPRAFSIPVHVKPYYDYTSAEWNAAYNKLARAFNRPPDQMVRVYFSREGLGNLYIDAIPEQIKPNKERDTVELLFTAPDPRFTVHNVTDSVFVDIPVGGPYPNLPATYNGTAPSEPVLTLQVMDTSTYWQYSRRVTATNNTDVALVNYPICISLGDVNPLITAGKLRADLGDIRLESWGGSRKNIYVRDASGGARTDVRVWFIMYQFLPREVKTLRLLYGNANATADAESAADKPMFEMSLSDNAAWRYDTFAMPEGHWRARIFQFGGHAAPAVNLEPIWFIHPAFTQPSVDEVNAAGARCVAYAPASGTKGMELTTPLLIQSVQYQYKTRTGGGKTPFVTKKKGPSGWETVFTERADTGQRTTISIAADAGNTTVWVRSTIGLSVGQNIQIQLDSGAYDTRTISVLGNNPTNGPFITFTGGGLSSSAAVGNEVSLYPLGYTHPQKTHTFTAPYPWGVMFGLTGERPDFNSGDWYWGAAEWAVVTFLAAQVPTVALDAEVAIVHHVSGQMTNTLTGEVIGLNTVLEALGDRIVLDCAARTCLFFPNGGGPAQDRFDAIVFPDTVNYYWVHLEPSTAPQVVTFQGPNLGGLRVTIQNPVKHW